MPQPHSESQNAIRWLADQAGGFERPFGDFDPRAETAMTLLLDALDLDNRNQLADFLGLRPSVLQGWMERGIPPTYCPVLERYTKRRVRARQLRPDWFPKRA